MIRTLKICLSRIGNAILFPEGCRIQSRFGVSGKMVFL